MDDSLDKVRDEVIACRLCPRLVEWREKVAREKRRAYRDEVYWGKPVPGFGDPKAKVFIVGLAPGAHGSNRTGRQFTGDASGNFLYASLYRNGFASQSASFSREDGLRLINVYTAPVCRCAPPENKPMTEEMDNCQPFLQREIEILRPAIFVTLGRIAFDRITRFFPAQKQGGNFTHNAIVRLADGRYLVASYHPSRQNTQTGRLTEAMFDQVWETVRRLL